MGTQHLLGALRRTQEITVFTKSGNQYILKSTGGSLRLKHEGTATGDDIVFELADGGKIHTFAKDGSATFAGDVTIASTKTLHIGGGNGIGILNVTQPSGTAMLKQIVIDTGSTAQDWSFGTDLQSNYVDFVLQSEYGNNTWTEAMRIAKDGKQVTTQGDIVMTGTRSLKATNDLKIYADGQKMVDFWLSGSDNHTLFSTDIFKLDGKLMVDANATPSAEHAMTVTGGIEMRDASTYGLTFAHTDNNRKWYLYLSTNDLKFYRAGSGAKLTLLDNGDATFAGNINLSATKVLYLDGASGHTFIAEYAANKMQLQAGGVGSIILDGTNADFRMGVGTSSPDRLLHVYKGSAGSITADSNLDLVVEDDGDTGLQILTPNANYGRIYFGSAAGASRGRIVYGGSTVSTTDERDTMMFMTGGGSERLRITGTGETDFRGNYVVNEQGKQDHVANTISFPYYSFDGVNDYVSIADSNHLSFVGGGVDMPFSITAWIYMEDATNFPITSKGVYNSTGEWLFGTDSGDLLKFQLHDESVADTYEKASTTTVAGYENQWIHVAATYNGVGGTSANAGMAIYINGVAQSLTLAGNGTYVDMENLAAATYIGRYDTDYGRGSISKVRFWNIELSATEVKEDYSGMSVPFKYKGANNTEMITDGDGSSDSMSKETNWSYNATDDDWDKSGTNQASVNQDVSAGLGKSYMGRFEIKSISYGGVKFLVGAYQGGAANKTTVGIHHQGPVHNAHASSTSLIYFDGNMTGTIDNLSAIPAGCVAEYDGSGATADKWHDKSGNNLVGTVTGASLENKVAALDVTDQITSAGQVKAAHFLVTGTQVNWGADGGTANRFRIQGGSGAGTELSVMDSQSMTFKTEDTLVLTLDTSQNAIFTGNVSPATDNVGTLGSDGKMWDIVWTNQIYSSGGSMIYQNNTQFDGDVSVIRAANAVLTVKATASGTGARLKLKSASNDSTYISYEDNDDTALASIFSHGSAFSTTALRKALEFKTGGSTTALTLDSSQNATFTGTIINLPNGQILSNSANELAMKAGASASLLLGANDTDQHLIINTSGNAHICWEYKYTTKLILMIGK